MWINVDNTSRMASHTSSWALRNLPYHPSRIFGCEDVWLTRSFHW